MSPAGDRTAADGLPLAAQANSSQNSSQNSDTCPRCGGGFHCGVQDSTPCACTGLQLSAAQLQALRVRYSHCVCLACLASVAAGQPV